MSKNRIFWHLVPRNPWIKIFFKILAVSLFLLNWPLTSCKVSEKLNERSPRYLKTDGQTDRRTDRRTDKGDYHGPHRVNPGSKIDTGAFLLQIKQKKVNMDKFLMYPQYLLIHGVSNLVIYRMTLLLLITIILSYWVYVNNLWQILFISHF